jgi:hypothetical protein
VIQLTKAAGPESGTCAMCPLAPRPTLSSDMRVTRQPRSR